MTDPFNNYTGVFQYFYHCKGEDLPIRDILDTQHKGHKTEPHYENLTENWCTKCMPGRIKSANKRQVPYLFLMTRYDNPGHEVDGRRLVVGYLHRAKPEVFEKLNQTRRRGAHRYESRHPKRCGFFAGDDDSRFVAANHAYVLETTRNCRWKYWCDSKEGKKIVTRLKKHPNILEELRERAEELKKEPRQEGEKHATCRK